MIRIALSLFENLAWGRNLANHLVGREFIPRTGRKDIASSVFDQVTVGGSVKDTKVSLGIGNCKVLVDVLAEKVPGTFSMTGLVLCCRVAFFEVCFVRLHEV